MDIFLQLESDFLRDVEATARSLRFQPCADIYETADALVIKIELPGIHPDRLSITLAADDRTLTIAGERAEMREEHRERVRFYQLEICYGFFEREISLPPGVHFDRDAITANYKDGFLVIALPRRREAPNRKRTIEIARE